MKAEARNYEHEVRARLEEQRGTIEILGEARHGDRAYPLVLATIGEGDLHVLVSGGVHGDEPAGVYAALEFLERDTPALASRFRFSVLPCVNPSGFEADTLESVAGLNLNRSFDVDSRAAEVVAVERWLRENEPRFRATFDLHEVVPHYRGEAWVEEDNPRGTYLYETIVGEHAAIGRRMIDDLPLAVDVCDWPEIYGDRNEHGVIRYPEACGNAIYAEATSLDAYLSGRFTGHSFVTETPTGWPLERRVAVHRHYLRTALEQLDC